MGGLTARAYPVRREVMSDEEIKPFDVRANAEWQKLGWTAESRTFFGIREETVPEQFRALIPYAIRWAIDCDVRRGDYMDKQPRNEVQEFFAAVTPHWEALNRWVDEPPLEGAKIPFMIMLKAYSEAAPSAPPEKRGGIRRNRR